VEIPNARTMEETYSEMESNIFHPEMKSIIFRPKHPKYAAQLSLMRGMARYKSSLLSSGSADEDKLLSTYMDLHQAMTDVMYIPPPEDQKLSQRTGTLCTVLVLLLVFTVIIILDYFVFWKPQEDEADENLQNIRQKLVNPTIIILTIFCRSLRMFDESHKHGIKRLLLFLLVPCKIFVALAALDSNEVGTQFRWSLLSCGLIASNCVIYGSFVAAIVKVGLLQTDSSYAVWLNMFVVATALSGFPFAEDVSPKCFTTIVLLQIPQEFTGLVLSGMFIFMKYGGKIPVQTAAWNFLTNVNILAVILGLFVSISGVETAFEDDVSYLILNQALVAISNCLKPLTMVYIGLSLNRISIENIAQVACIFLKRSSWIIAGLYFYLAPSDTDDSSFLAVLFFMNSTCSMYIFMHLENTANLLDQKIKAGKKGGELGGVSSSLRVQRLDHAIGSIMPLICYDFAFTIFLNIVISINKKWFTNGTNVMLSGLVFTIIGTGVVGVGVYLGGDELGSNTTSEHKLEMASTNTDDNPQIYL